MKKKIVTIHQPDFMPWLGFFKKINQSDTFVVLDHVTNKYKGQSWFRRVMLANHSGQYWLSISIKKPENNSYLPINEMRINKEVDYTNSLKTIQRVYAKAPYFHTVYPLVERWFNSNEPLLYKRNMSFIIDVMALLNIDTKIIYSHPLNYKSKSNELLIEILKSQNADVYRCGDGASGYQKDNLFLNNSIEIEYNNFEIEPYTQINTKEFQGGLSIVDTLMNIGVEETKKIINKI
jgi:hypothetical protein